MTLSASFSKDCFLPPFLYQKGKKMGANNFFLIFLPNDGSEKECLFPVVRKCVPLSDKFPPPSPEGENGDGAVRQKRTEEPSRIV